MSMTLRRVPEQFVQSWPYSSRPKKPTGWVQDVNWELLIVAGLYLLFVDILVALVLAWLG